MTTIHTRYVGPTDTRGSRLVAQVGDWRRGDPGRVTVPYRHNLSSTQNHDTAAAALYDHLGWGVTAFTGYTEGKKGPTREFIRGGTRHGYVYVFADDDRVRL